MLVMTPQARKMLRKERRRERDSLRGRLGEDRHNSMVQRVMGVIRGELDAGRIASPFGLEGPLRHALRGSLCLDGWRWADADEAARHLLDATFSRLRATRPAWAEGQPEWVVHAGTLIGRTRCARCGTDLPDGHYKYCSRLCASAQQKAIAKMKEASEVIALDIAVRRSR